MTEISAQLKLVKINAYITSRDTLFINTLFKDVTLIKSAFYAQILITRAKMVPRRRRRSTVASRSPSTPLPTR